MPPHWAPKMSKSDWADDIRSDLAKLLPHKAADLYLPTLEDMSLRDLSRLAEAIDELVKLINNHQPSDQ